MHRGWTAGTAGAAARKSAADAGRDIFEGQRLHLGGRQATGKRPKCQTRIPYQPLKLAICRPTKDIEILGHGDIAVKIHRQVVERHGLEKTVDIQHFADLRFEIFIWILGQHTGEPDEIAPVVLIFKRLLLKGHSVAGSVIAPVFERAADVAFVQPSVASLFREVHLQKVVVDHFA